MKKNVNFYESSNHIYLEDDNTRFRVRKDLSCPEFTTEPSVLNKVSRKRYSLKGFNRHVIYALYRNMSNIEPWIYKSQSYKVSNRKYDWNEAKDGDLVHYCHPGNTNREIWLVKKIKDTKLKNIFCLINPKLDDEYFKYEKDKIYDFESCRYSKNRIINLGTINFNYLRKIVLL